MKFVVRWATWPLRAVVYGMVFRLLRKLLP